ncbi:MAG: endonuclease domain-containing protein [Planctomycetaceae bacterium]|nr:endonuclease domain-containing protein [Planctomycetaceae bacterium]MCA9044886.1 endonuclease domain-containing protein [Planctomycetaceae bacterium]
MGRRRKASRNLGHAREHRRNATQPEKKLWMALRDRRLAGLKFRRQFPVEGFIADFACVEQKLIIEVDGDSHADQYSHDMTRQETLERAGWRVARVSNDDVLQNLEGVLTQIAAAAGLDPEQWRDGVYGQAPDSSV